MTATTAYLGLGANQGDREGQLRRALERLAMVPGVRVEAVSALRRTEPLGGPSQGTFLNGAARIRTTLPPHALLAVCKELEREAGRELPAPRGAPRPLDLDLLLYGDRVLDTADLVVPHPALHERPFVLEPLQELGVDTGAIPRRERPAVDRDPARFAARCGHWSAGGCRIGLVPTMGALHEGHAGLVRRARRECDRVAVSLFVNPRQFGVGEDLERYPRGLDRDLGVLRAEGADAVLVPEVEGMYPEGFCSEVAVGAEAEGMEGTHRPGHFRGVATVVARLLALARPHRAYFGRKDAQQVFVLRRLVRDLGFPVEVVECSTARAPDGLALSSRNAYLDAGARQAATSLFRALSAARAAHVAGERDRDRLLAAARAVLDAEPRAAVEYLELRREQDLGPIPAGAVGRGRMLVAARVGGTRLIDNLSLDPADDPDGEPGP